MSEIAVELADIMEASVNLDEFGDAYTPFIQGLSEISSLSGAFEPGQMSEAWTTAVTTLWSFCADSSDNIHEASNVLMRYVNAVCAQDETNATALSDEIEGHNKSMEYTSAEQGDQVGTILPEPDLNNPDRMFDEPSKDKADRPEDL